MYNKVIKNLLKSDEYRNTSYLLTYEYAKNVVNFCLKLYESLKLVNYLF